MQRCVLRNVGTMFCAGSLPCKSIFTNFHEENLMKQVVLNASLAFFAGSGLPGRVDSCREKGSRTHDIPAFRPCGTARESANSHKKPHGAAPTPSVFRCGGGLAWRRTRVVDAEHASVLTLLNELRTPQMPHKHLIPHTHIARVGGERQR